MDLLQAGTLRHLKIERATSFGYFLIAGTQDILLHETEAEPGLSVGDEVEVFLYRDKKDRLAATMTMPHIVLGTYGWLTVAGVKEHLGVFVNIGIKRDILLSKDDLPDPFEQWPQVGEQVYGTLKLDRHGRLLILLANEEKINDLIRPATSDRFNENITGTVCRLLNAGAVFVSGQGVKGFIHQSEQREIPHLGQKISGRIIHVKEDGTVNVSLLPRNHERISSDSEVIFSYLQSRGGSMPYTDQSLPEDIQKRFHMSKGAFKRALGRLMRENKVRQSEGWTYVSETSKDGNV